MANEKTVKSIRLDAVHLDLVKKLKPFYGTTDGEVIRNIVLMWLHNNLGSQTMGELKRNHAVSLGGHDDKEETH